MATYFVIARMDGTRQIGSDRQVVNLAHVLDRGITHFIQVPELDEDEQHADPYGLLAHPDPAQTGLGIADDMTLTLGVDGAFRLFQLQAVPAPEHFTPSSAVGARSIVTREFLVTGEVPAWWAYGPHGRQVLGLIHALAGMRREQLDAIGRRTDSAGLDFARVKFESLAAADRVIADAGRTGASRLARGYARAATYGTWDRDSALGHAASLAGDLAHVMTVADLLPDGPVDAMTKWLAPELFDIPFAGQGPEYPELGKDEPLDGDEETDAAPNAS